MIFKLIIIAWGFGTGYGVAIYELGQYDTSIQCEEILKENRALIKRKFRRFELFCIRAE